MSDQGRSFPRSSRLTTPKNYQDVFQQGQRARNALFGGVVRINTLDHARLGLAVSRKASPRAVVRNRIKRAVREVFRQQQSALDALDFVIIAYPQAAAATKTELACAASQLVQKLTRTCARS
ncbi:MAG: ribonuclease P protein component [Gammaproteobacteria bacterium]|nr:ribonuclease P protein component [Gammaproteobacteria bacterium]